MGSVYVIGMFILSIFAFSCICIASINYAFEASAGDADDRKGAARWLLRSLLGIPFTLLWPIALPVAIFFVIRKAMRDAEIEISPVKGEGVNQFVGSDTRTGKARTWLRRT
jgi:hypothetical protein